MESWQQHIDLYCERLGPGLWAEPLNLLTNAGFLVAAWLLFRDARQRHRGVAVPRHQATPFGVYTGLAVAVAVIGIGSGLFHSFATVWAQAADVIPIAAFVVFYAYALPRWGFEWSAGRSGCVVLGLGLATGLGLLVPGSWANGSQMYFGPLAILLVLALLARFRVRRTSGLCLGAAFAVFVISLLLRMVDQQLCSVWPYGTHFGWHLANAGVLYLAVREYAATLAREGSC